jgi:5-hydroxyisourate hydrolase-like protein (transthyretin family)
MRKSLVLLPLLSLTVAGLVACSNNENVAGGPGSITTNGLALVDGQPASYASVALRKVGYKAEKPVEENALVTADTYADEKGNFKVDIPADGKYRLTVAHDGVAYSRVVTRNDFAELGVAQKPDTVRLEPTAVLAGAVDIPEGSSTVWVGVVGTDILVKTDEAGWFALSALPANDSLTLYFVNEDYDEDLGEKSIYVNPMESVMQDYRTEVEVPEDTTAKDTAKTDTTSPDKLPQVLALLNNGTPAAYATVALRKADAMVSEYVVQNAVVESDLRTDKNGRFDMEWPTKGNYRLTVFKSGYAYSKVYSAKELAKLDTIHLDATASVSGKVTLRSNAEYLWVGVYGLDLMVKTNDVGSYVLPNVPANDSLGIYFVTADSANSLYAEWNAIAEPYSTEFLSPVMVLQDFEGDFDGWYVNTDALFKGTTLTPAKNVADGVVYDSTRKSKVFHGKYKLADDDYAWVLVGTMFDHEMNFSAIDSVVFYAKGDGNIRLSLENYINDTKSLKAATDWMPLSKDWKRISVNPAELCVGNAKTETCFTSWSGVKNVVKQLHIFPQDGTEFYIDDVTLYGALF